MFSKHVPRVFRSVAELAASNASRQAEVADGDGVVLVLIGEGVSALGHGTHKDADALLGTEALDVVPALHNRRVEGEGHLTAVGWQVVGYGVLDDFEQFLLRCRGADGEFVEELDHQTCEALEGTGNADGRRDFDEDTFGGVDVYLELASFVDGGIKEGEEALLIESH